MSQAQADADRIVGEARFKAETTERESQVTRAALEARVEDLRNFEREYRTRMRGYFENQLRELETRGGADPAGVLGSSAVQAVAAAAPAAIPAAAPAPAPEPVQAAPIQQPPAAPVPAPGPAAQPAQQPAPQYQPQPQAAPAPAPAPQQPVQQPVQPPVQQPVQQPIVTPPSPFPPTGTGRPAGPFSPPAATPVPRTEGE